MYTPYRKSRFDSLFPRRSAHRLALTLLTLSLLPLSNVWARGEVVSVVTSTTPATPLSYTAGGDTYQFGQGNNRIIESFNYAGTDYDFRRLGNSVVIRRVDNPGVAEGKPCSLFATTAGDFFTYEPDYPDDGTGTGNCDMETLMGGRVVNRGALDVFSNFGYTVKNIERIDFIFTHGIIAPLNEAWLDQTGHIATEKTGNNPVKIAAITSLDANGAPTGYGPLVSINKVGCTGDDLCYGQTTLSENYGFLENEALPPQGYVTNNNAGDIEPLAIAFVSMEDLGIQAGQKYYGFSYFGFDVDENQHDLLDPSSFPLDTSDNSVGDTADLYGGTSGYFINANLNTLSGRMFMDDNGNGVLDAGEAGIPSISVALFADTNLNGVYDDGIDTQIGEAAESTDSGQYYFSAMTDGTFFVTVSTNDPDAPTGYTYSGADARVAVTFNQSDINVDFPFAAADDNTNVDTPTDGGTTDPVTPDAGNDGIPQTGLNGHGAGSLGLGGLMGLLGLGALRRWKRGAVPSAVAVSLLTAQGVSAEPSPSERDFDQRFYLGGGVSASLLEPDPNNPAHSVTDDNSSGGLVFIGYDVSKRLSVEGFYGDLGSAQMSISGAAPADLDYQVYGLSAIGYLWNSRKASDYEHGWDDEGYFRREGLSAFVRAGFSGLENDADFAYNQRHGAEAHFGGGLEYGFKNGFAVRAEGVSYDEDAKAFHLSLLKRFGEAKPFIIATAPPPPAPEPAPEPKAREVIMTLPSALFAFDSALLTERATGALTEFADQLQASPDLNIIIEGHTCSIGSDEYNQGLSERRAESVRSFLQSQGIDAGRMKAVGYGESRPIADNGTREGREANRRVEVVKDQ